MGERMHPLVRQGGVEVKNRRNQIVCLQGKRGSKMPKGPPILIERSTGVVGGPELVGEMNACM